jgi:hypothetical protein
MGAGVLTNQTILPETKFMLLPFQLVWFDRTGCLPYRVRCFRNHAQKSLVSNSGFTTDGYRYRGYCAPKQRLPPTLSRCGPLSRRLGRDVAIY